MNLFKQLIVVVGIFLAGCSTVANYQADLQTWVGQSEQALEAGWGVPVSIVISGPTRYLTYARNDGVYVQGGYWGRTVTPLYCSTVFSIQNNIVVRAQFQGNECTAY
ncbi:hypothetical protein [Polynucleobacter ibericus]|uniref:hypothetical protein n=1 Tax=Polynucleobacter ibericus TaxID=1819725 RepID=UPI001BFDD590|nr:hypothetical protein [Polynucleobacter ibericus]QWE09085.1 hypothetical protein AOC20_02390 [Polynucleobacter ibericus]